MGTIFGRQPAFWIGLIVALVAAVVQTLTGQGLISDAAAGRITDGVTALSQLATLLAPLIAGLLIKPTVTPVAFPQLAIGTPVLVQATPGTPQAIVPAAVVAPAAAPTTPAVATPAVTNEVKP